MADYTPRTKKKSLLSKRAAQKKSFLTEDNITDSRDSITTGDGDLSRGYPLDANVQIQRNGKEEEESDEGIYLGNTPVHQSLHNEQRDLNNSAGRFQKTYDVEQSSSRLSHGEYSRSAAKSENRYADVNFDSDELKSDNSDTLPGSKSPPPGRFSKSKSSVSPGNNPFPSTSARPHTVLPDSDGESDAEVEMTTSGFPLDQTTDSVEEQHSSYKAVLSNISNSDIDLRKHKHIEPHSYRLEQRTASMSQADMERSGIPEVEDSLGDLRSFGQPRPSQLSPTPGHRATGVERPWSSGGLLGVPNRNLDMLSERSFASTSAVPHMTPRQAKERSFLLGSAAGLGSLLGTDELERFFPDRQMKVYVGSWNMCEMKHIPESLDELVHPDSLNSVCDVYVFGTQESCPNRREWEVRLQESLGPHHVLFHSAVYGVLYLMVFVRKDLIWYCSVSEESNCGTRAGPSGFKTKGAVAMCFTLFGTSLLFINCHLSPHDGKKKERVEDYKKISRIIDLPKVVKHVQTDFTDKTDVTSRFDSVFWFGDMNWRIVKEHNHIKNKIGGIKAQDIPAYDELLEHDELTHVRAQEAAFTMFQEGRIKFPPTYKYDIGSDRFDTTKMRIPSYTDRILFRSKKKGGVTCLHYNCASNLRESDHRPVYGMYEVNLRPGRDNIPLSAGQFNREVWLTAMKRRALKMDISNKVHHEKASSVCNVQ